MGHGNSDKSKRGSSSKRPPTPNPAPAASRFWQDVMSIDSPGQSGSSSSSVRPPASASSKKKPPLGARKPPSKQRSNRTHSLRPFQCELCTSRFERKGHLESHVETVHHGLRPHNCTHDSCPKTFGHRSSLSRHVRNVHDNPNHPSHKNKHHHHSAPPPPPPQ